MKLYLDTSTPTCILGLDKTIYKAELDHDMAEKLLEFIKTSLDKEGKTWSDITAIGFFSGPGSFTGLRIGASVVNTLADQLGVPLFDHHGKQHPVIIPDYGRPANISTPRK